MLIDTGRSISILPRQVWLELEFDEWPQLKAAEVNIEVVNGERLGTDGTISLSFSVYDFEFMHTFFICADSSTAIFGNDFIVHNRIQLFIADGWMSYQGNDIHLFDHHGASQE